MSTNNPNPLLPGHVRGPRLPGWHTKAAPRANAYSHLVSRKKPSCLFQGYALMSGIEVTPPVESTYHEVKRLYTVNHNLLAPDFWVGQIVAIVAPEPLPSWGDYSHECRDGAQLVRLAGHEFICMIGATSPEAKENQNCLALYFHVDASRLGLCTAVERDDPDFEHLGTVLHPLAYEDRQRRFWPAMHTISN